MTTKNDDLREQIERAREGYVMVPSEPTDAMCGVVEYGAASRMCETRLSERKDFLRKAITAGSHPPAQAAQDVADEARDTSITDAFDAMHPITTAEPVAQGEAVDEIEDFGKDHEWDGQKWVRKAAQPASPEQPAGRQGEAFPMTEQQVRQWIDACNSKSARQVLRDYLRMRAYPAAPVGAPDGCVLVPQRFVECVRAANHRDVHPRAVPQLIEEAMEALAAATSAPQGVE